MVGAGALSIKKLIYTPINDEDIDMNNENLTIWKKSFEIKYEIEPGIISNAIPKIIPVDFNEATIISDKIAKKI